MICLSLSNHLTITAVKVLGCASEDDDEGTKFTQCSIESITRAFDSTDPASQVNILLALSHAAHGQYHVSKDYSTELQMLNRELTTKFEMIMGW